MKRFASHYLFLPEYGFLKQYIVDIDNAGVITCIAPLVHEQEAVSWLPGLISFIPKGIIEDEIPLFITHSIRKSPILLEHIPLSSLLLEDYLNGKATIWAYPFSFADMQPFVHTKYRKV